MDSALYLVDKPVGPTSFGVLRSLQPALGRKLGHAGTLDPFASGLLLVLAGRATRLAQFLSGLDKTYRAHVQFGWTSTTLDPEGDLTQTGGRAAEDEVRAAAAGLTGDVLQRVPAASAVKIAGERSYARMRRGEAVEAPPRPVRIDRVDVCSFDAGLQRAEIEVACSKGTYVRQIAADLGEAVGAGAYCAELRRTAVGRFAVERAGTPEQVVGDPSGRWRVEPAEALAHLPQRPLTPQEGVDIGHGRAIELAGETEATALLQAGRLLAVAEPRDGRLRPTVVLAG